MPESLRVKCYKFSKINDPLQDGEQSQAFMTFHYSEPVLVWSDRKWKNSYLRMFYQNEWQIFISIHLNFLPQQFQA